MGAVRTAASAILAAVLLAGTAQGSTARPQLRLTTSTTVAGSGFRAKERLLLVVSAENGKQRKTVQASAAGSFVARLNAAVAYDQCHFALISVTRASGTRVLAKVGGGSKDCAPPPPGRDG